MKVSRPRKWLKPKKAEATPRVRAPKPPWRTFAEVPFHELLAAVVGQGDTAAVAGVLGVPLLELHAALAEDPDLRRKLKLARDAAAEFAATKIALGRAAAASSLGLLLQHATSHDSNRVGAANALLNHGALIAKADAEKTGAEVDGWAPKPGAFPVRLIQGGASESRRVAGTPTPQAATPSQPSSPRLSDALVAAVKGAAAPTKITGGAA